MTHLPCDLDPAEQAKPTEPYWFSAVSATARIDARSRVTAEHVTDFFGAPFLRVQVASDQGGVFILEVSDAGQSALAKTIAGAMVERLTAVK